MSFRIGIRGRGDGFTAVPGESLLEAGRRAGYTFPQACRNGNCWRCEGVLLQGTVRHQRSLQVLRAGGTPMPVLPCIVEACSDCEIAVEGVFGPGELPVVETAAQVVAVEDLTAEVARVRLLLPAGRRVARLAGQYLEVLAGDEAWAFSIASPPESGRELELHVRHGEANASSLRVIAHLRAEPVVRLRLPLGDCTLAGEPGLPLLFIAGSTGFSQVQALVGHALAGGWRVPMAVAWGCRTAADFYLPDVPRDWASRGVRVALAVSSPGAGVPAGHVGGLAHEAALTLLDDPARVQVYVCGSPAMAYAALDALVARGVPPERVFSDVFAWAPRP